jgi:hypothetical protein
VRTLPSEAELRECFLDFAHFSMSLIQNSETNPKYLKYSVVNSQISLELFLKYYFKKRGDEDVIRKVKNGVLQNDYVDFQQILSHFFSSRKWSYGNKKELLRILDARNDIVHRAQSAAWDNDLAEAVVGTCFFIHATAWSGFGENALYNNYEPHELSKVKIWRVGAESFADRVAKMWGGTTKKCVQCCSKTVVSGDFMALDESNADQDDMVCLCCLTSVNIQDEARHNFMQCVRS